ncbi:MAG: LysM peptidoglycan-binding domain-containing protein [Inquilinaceae bacterium]
MAGALGFGLYTRLRPVDLLQTAESPPAETGATGADRGGESEPDDAPATAAEAPRTPAADADVARSASEPVPPTTPAGSPVGPDATAGPSPSAGAGTASPAPERAEASVSATSTAPPAATGATGGAALVSRAEDPAATDPETAGPSPSFDAVRVNRQGDAVIAGRAAPNAEIVIRDAEEEVGRVKADERGDWVYVSDVPLRPGSRELSLESTLPGDSEAVPSNDIVVLVVPEDAPAGAAVGGDTGTAGPDAAGSGVLALLVPREEAGPTTILQAPAEPAGAPDASLPQLPPDRPVSIDVVDYDERGNVIVGGRSPPDANVRLYVDNTLVGATESGPDGVFRISPDAPIAPGDYSLRADQVSPDGAVMARAETPFRRARPDAAVSAGTSGARLVVQPGNSLWRIARRIYGEGIQYSVIYQANRSQIRDPDLIYPGQIFDLPPESRGG